MTKHVITVAFLALLAGSASAAQNSSVNAAANAPTEYGQDSGPMNAKVCRDQLGLRGARLTDCQKEWKASTSDSDRQKIRARYQAPDTSSGMSPNGTNVKRPAPTVNPYTGTVPGAPAHP